MSNQLTAVHCPRCGVRLLALTVPTNVRVNCGRVTVAWDDSTIEHECDA